VVWAVQKNSAVEMFSQIFLIVFLGCFQSAISIDNHNEIEQRFGAGDILGFKIMDGEPRNGPFTIPIIQTRINCLNCIRKKRKLCLKWKKTIFGLYRCTKFSRKWKLLNRPIQFPK